jgi:hypothetical protein
MRDETFRDPVPMTEEEIAAYHRIGELPPPSCLVAPDLHDGYAAAASDVSRVDRALQARRLPHIPSWVQHPEKWVTLSRAERRQLERHHRKVNGR